MTGLNLMILSIILYVICFFVHLEVQFGPHPSNLNLMNKMRYGILISLILFIAGVAWHLIIIWLLFKH